MEKMVEREREREYGSTTRKNGLCDRSRLGEKKTTNKGNRLGSVGSSQQIWKRIC